LLSGAQLGITVASLAVGFIAEPALGRALGPVVGAVGIPDGARTGVAATVGFVLATVALMVVGELAPKNLAIARPEPVARAVAGSMLIFLRVAGPLDRAVPRSRRTPPRSAQTSPAGRMCPPTR